jgi:LAO/AO transport system kinase
MTEISTLYQKAVSGDIGSLAKLLSAIENRGEDKFAIAKLLNGSLDSKAHVVGITGPPGAGKSSVVNALLKQARKTEHKIGVLAVDPSSPFSGGAILGDRVRMNDHVLDSGIYIRSFSSRGQSGGLSSSIPLATRLLSSLDFGLIIIETVGVGQIEVEIMDCADSVCVVLNPGWGDSVQAAKAGLLEIGDIFVINKADRPGVKETERDLKAMIEMGEARVWRPKIIKTIATDDTGIKELYAAITDHAAYLKESGNLIKKRKDRLYQEFESALVALLKDFINSKSDQSLIKEVKDRLLEGSIDPLEAARFVFFQFGGCNS